jgi:hypothetical protein
MLSLLKQNIEFECPECNFKNKATLRQITIQDTIICRGCKSNINLNDHFGSAKKAINKINMLINNLFT